MSVEAVTAAPAQPRISVVIPTWKRAAWLDRCIRAVAEQDPPPAEIIVVGRAEDMQAREVAGRLDVEFTVPVCWIEVDRPGHVAPVERGVEVARFELVALIDDDAVPQPGWLRAIVAPFDDPSVGCVGGRVVVPDGIRPADERLVVREDAGTLRWYGKLVGNLGELDHAGVSERDTVVECNWVWRRSLLAALEVDPIVDHDEAAFYGLDLTLQARALGFRTLYEPRARVDHYLAPRDEQLVREDRRARARAASRNFTYLALKHFGALRKAAFLCWSFLIGARRQPGLAASALVLAERPGAWREIRAAWQGKLEGLTAALSTRRPDLLVSRGSTTKPRIVVFDAFPTQFFGPYYRWLTASERVDLTVVYWETAETEHVIDPELGRAPVFDIPITGGYRDYVMRRGPRGVLDCWRWTRQARDADAVLLSGWARPRELTLLAFGHLRGLPMLVTSDVTPLYDDSARRPSLRRRALRRLVRTIPGFMATGSLAREHLTSLGVPEDRIFFRPYAPDNAAFAAATAAERAARAARRAALRIASDARVVLAIAKLVEREGVDELIDALAAVRTPGLVCVVVGDGPMQERLERTVERDGTKVLFVGYQPYSVLPRFYALADLFVHPARRESWGVSVNEAMASGVPVVVSNMVGSGYDLVREGVTGSTYPSGDSKALGAAIDDFFGKSDTERAAMAAAAQEWVDGWSFARAADELDRAVDFLYSARSTR
ncbi:MAG: glycosyltransferase [Acidimicrobiia bacterium]